MINDREHGLRPLSFVLSFAMTERLFLSFLVSVSLSFVLSLHVSFSRHCEGKDQGADQGGERPADDWASQDAATEPLTAAPRDAATEPLTAAPRDAATDTVTNDRPAGMVSGAAGCGLRAAGCGEVSDCGMLAGLRQRLQGYERSLRTGGQRGGCTRARMPCAGGTSRCSWTYYLRGCGGLPLTTLVHGQ